VGECEGECEGELDADFTGNNGLGLAKKYRGMFALFILLPLRLLTHPARASSGRRRSPARTGRAMVPKFCCPPIV
jgi:hypothetical protein